MFHERVKQMKSQSIIVPFHKNADMLKFCIKTLMATIPYNIEIIVVGNNYNSEELNIILPDNMI